MYGNKSFKIRPFNDIEQEIISMRPFADKINKIFLADGDTPVLSTEKLKEILELINANFPRVRRISCYAKPKDMARKSVNELIELRKLGLSIIYTGIESGCDELLAINSKGETFDSSVRGLLNAKKAGIKMSVMIFNGLGGKEFTNIHALKSAELVNIAQPEYLSNLVLSYPYGIEHYKMRLKRNFDELSAVELLSELRLFIEHTDLESTIFRSDHVSNFLVLKGVLGKDIIF